MSERKTPRTDAAQAEIAADGLVDPSFARAREIETQELAWWLLIAHGFIDPDKSTHHANTARYVEGILAAHKAKQPKEVANG